MAKRRKINTQDLAATLLTVAITIGTLIAVFFIPPENVRTESDDTVLTVRGVSTKENQPSTRRREDISGPFTAVVSPVYEIITPTQLAGSVELDFKYDLNWLGGSGEHLLRLMTFDQTLNAWRTVDSWINYDKRQVEATVLQLETESLWALGVFVPLTLERDQELLLQEIVNRPPPGAMAYQAYSALAIVPGDFIVIRDPLDQGGCDGLFQVGKEKEVTVAEKEVNGATLNVTVVWQKATGCLREQKLQSSIFSSDEESVEETTN